MHLRRNGGGAARGFRVSTSTAVRNAGKPTAAAEKPGAEGL
jgi:hypothetical protein